MNTINSTLDKIFSLIDESTKLALQISFDIIKVFLLFFSLILSGFLIFVWIKLEIKNRDEIDKWKGLIKNIKDFFFIKENAKKRFEEIKKLFYQDKIQGLIEINDFFNSVLNTFGYEGNLKEKLEKIAPQILPSKEEIKKAVEIVEILKEKRSQLSEEEYLMIFHQYEIALKELNVITEQDFLATSLK